MCFSNVEMISREHGKITCSPLINQGSLPGLSPVGEGTDGKMELLGATGPYGSIVHHEIREETYSLWHSRYILRQDMTLVITSDQPALSLNFVLKSDINYLLDGFLKDTMLEQQFNMVYIPRTKCSYTFRKNEEYALFGIQYTYGYLERWNNQFPLLKNFLNNAKNNVPAMISSAHPTATPEMKVIISDILNGMYAKPVRKMRLEGKALELLEASLEQVSSSDSGTGHIRFADSDLNKMRQARKYLLWNLGKQITLRSLAHEVGTNVFKLKKGFKLMYGVTVFEFLREERMQKARKLLRETQMPIYKIASIVGYYNPANFATTFKKRFGYSPRRFRG